MRIVNTLTLNLITFACCVSAYATEGLVYQYEEEKPEAAPIPRLSSFQQVADAARTHGVPILVEFSTPWCQYCEALEEQILKPLILSGKYEGQIIIKKMEVNTYSSVTGFDGKQYRSDQLSRMYNVGLYPTLVFFDASGREISPRIVGITVIDYVAEQLDMSIDSAVQATTGAL